MDPAFQRAIDDRLLEEIAGRDLPVEFLDPAARDSWLDNVVTIALDRMAPPQLQLL